MNKLSGAETASALCDPPPTSVRCAASGKWREDRRRRGSGWLGGLNLAPFNPRKKYRDRRSFQALKRKQQLREVLRVVDSCLVCEPPYLQRSA